MNSFDRIKHVFIKEVLDNLRDRRSLSSGLLSSLIGPAILLALIVIIGKSVFKDQTETRLRLPVAGAERAPVLIQFLDQNGVDVVPAPDDPESEVRNGDADVVLIIPEGYGQQFSAGRPATLRLVIDSSRQSAIASVERASRILESYSQQIGSLRLIARGMNPSVVQALSIERQDMATPQTQALIFLNMMPYFIVLVVFLGGMYVIIDTTAGERERGSL